MDFKDVYTFSQEIDLLQGNNYPYSYVLVIEVIAMIMYRKFFLGF